MTTIIGVGCFLLVFGLLIVALGIVLWKKQKTGWVSTNANVKEKDVKAFTRMSGQATIGIGISVACWGFFWIMRQTITALIVFGAVFVVSMVIYFIAQKRYN